MNTENASVTGRPKILEFLSLEFYGNTLLELACAAAVPIIALLLLRYIKCCGLKKLENRAAHSHIRWARYLLDSLQKTKKIILIAVSLYAGLQFISLPPPAENFSHMALVILLLLQTGLWINNILSVWAKEYRANQVKKNPASVSIIGMLDLIFQIAVWVFIFLLMLDNLGFNIMTLLAGLGIGGIAVALAVQSTLGDVLASLSIVMDKTFVIGDFVTVDEYAGTIEYIGLKNTRIRSLSGEQIIFSNTDLLNSRIRNYGRMHERRIQNRIGVVYQTERQCLQKIPQFIKQAIETQEKIRFDYAHFATLGVSGFEIEYVYYILSADYNFFMRTQESIHLKILELLEKESIALAYPTQTIYFNPVSSGQSGTPGAAERRKTENYRQMRG